MWTQVVGVTALVGAWYGQRASAQETFTETVYAAVVFTYHGEQTPLISPSANVLTPLGAQQLMSAGSFLRARYVNPMPVANTSTGSNSAIQGLAQDQLNNSQLYIISPGIEYISASAQAFFQGLYPPLEGSDNITDTSAAATLANGSTIQSPLQGYQYPQVYAITEVDPDLVWIMGDLNCPEYDLSGAEYYSTPDFVQTQTGSGSLYNSLVPGIIGNDTLDVPVGYFNAFDVFDYVNYGYTHDTAIHNSITAFDLAQLRTLADQQQYALNGNLSASGLVEGDMIRAIAGRALAAKVKGLLLDTIESQGSQEILSLLFGDYQPFVAFFALALLPSINADFYGLPAFGSSMVFELFSTDNNTAYPAESDLNVRFLFRNGTDDSAEMLSYPLFGRGPDETDMTWQDFSDGLDQFALESVGDWCDTCNSQEYFCAIWGTTDSAFNIGSSPSSSGECSSASHAVTPPVAGVIGAAVTLAVLILTAAVCILLFGVRFHRVTKRRSELGGFKGSEKLASDADLTLTGAAAAPGTAARGHERSGSWELKNSEAGGAAVPAAGAGLQSDGSAHPGRRVDDQDDPSVNPFAQPVGVDESV
ncbi:MAG: hypothetical protein M1838_001648 [Thelocarpon superellum]|nr:MAG: hypothetical protein M1838_001648 [Thelocarpon superellum]